MKEKFDSIRKRLTEMQSGAHSLSADIDALLGEMDAKKPTVVDLDAKVQRSNEIDAKISDATQKLIDVQQKHASVSESLKRMKESIAV